MSAYQNKTKERVIKYIQLSENIIEKIQNGFLSSGEKLPSLRQFSQQNSISLTTAIRCYEHLEELGYVQAVDKSGFYICTAQQKNVNIEFPAFKSEKCSLNLSKFQKESPIKSAELAPLLTAQLGSEYFPKDMLQRCFSRVFRNNDMNQYSYGNAKGADHLRGAITYHFSKKGLMLDAEELVITNGCLDAVAMAIDIVSKPKDIIIVTSPCYNGLLQLLSLMEREVIEIPSTENGIDFKQLAFIVENNDIAACLLTATFQNPTGHSLSAEQKQWLAEFADRKQLPIIEDDVFSELNHQGIMALPIKYWDKSGWVIWCSSVSKTLAPGMRLGWCATGRFTQQFIKHRTIKTLSVNQPLQEGLAQFISAGHYARHIRSVNKQLATQVIEYTSYFKKYLPASAIVSSPNGGLVLWIKVPKLSEDLFNQRCIDENVHVKTGSLFSSREYYTDCFRVNIGCPIDDNIKKEILLLCNIISSIVEA